MAALGWQAAPVDFQASGLSRETLEVFTTRESRAGRGSLIISSPSRVPNKPNKNLS